MGSLFMTLVERLWEGPTSQREHGESVKTVLDVYGRAAGPAGFSDPPGYKPECSPPAAAPFARDGAVGAGDDPAELEDEESNGEDEIGVSAPDEANVAEGELEEEGRQEEGQHGCHRASGAQKHQVELRQCHHRQPHHFRSTTL